MCKGLRELATKIKLGGKLDEVPTVTKTNELEKYYRRAIINNTYNLKCMQDAIVRRQTKDLTTSHVQRVHHRGVF